MTIDELRALADEYFEWPDDGDSRTVSTISALLFAQHVLEMHEMHGKMHEKHEKSLGTENNAGMDALREAAQQALEALHEETAWFGPTPKGAAAITALRAALEQEQEGAHGIGEKT